MAPEALQQNTEESSQTKTPPKAENQSRWKAGVQMPINMPVEESWAILGNFANAQEYIIGCLECKIIEGEPNAVNCVRFVKAGNIEGSAGSQWAHERLLSIDHEKHIQTYQVEENTFGFVNYQGCLKVDSGKNDTSVITWSLEMDPMPGLPPPPNPATELMTRIFTLFLKNTESKYLQKKGLEVEAAPEAIATA